MTRLGSALLALLLLPACFGDDVDTSAYVASAVVGNVQVRAADSQTFTRLTDGTKVNPGDAVRALSESSVTLTRGSESFLRLRPYEPADRCNDLEAAAKATCLDEVENETAPPADLTVETIERFGVSSGDVLVRSDETAPIVVGSRGVQARTEDGTFRFDRHLSLRVAVYEGTTTVEAAGATLSVGSLREGVIASRELPRDVGLLQFHPSDPWDRELLKDVIDLDRELMAQARGYEAEFGRRTRARDVDEEIEELQAVATDRDITFIRGSLRDTNKADVLIGLVFAFLLEERGQATAEQNYEAVLNLLDQGATWGFLARENAISYDDMTGGVVRAIGLRTGDVEKGTPIVGPPPPGPSRSPGPKPSESKKPKPTVSPSESKKPSSSPTPSTSPTPTETCTPIGPVCV